MSYITINKPSQRMIQIFDSLRKKEDSASRKTDESKRMCFYSKSVKKIPTSTIACFFNDVIPF